MGLEIGWRDILARLGLTILGAVLIGMNREEHGRAAGLRTTLLVSLAAAVAMIQVNILLGLTGRAANSFVVLDLMRLPLGILSGMGFIGAGAILRKDNLVLGVTTAATLWFVTIMGLCFGGGQLGLGCAALGLSLIVLVGLKPIEKRCKQSRWATLNIIAGSKDLTESELAQLAEILRQGGYKIIYSSITYAEEGVFREMNCELKWHAHVTHEPPQFLKTIATDFGLAKIEWRMLG